MRLPRKLLVPALIASMMGLPGVSTAEAPPTPGPEARCAVCGMYVAKYPTWVAMVETSDGGVLYFDGPKDMFRLLLEPEKHGQDPAILGDAWVTDYYSTRLIPARDAVFVAGSDVTGPMGAELVPLSSREDAAEFAADHGSTAVLTFEEITLDDIDS